MTKLRNPLFSLDAVRRLGNTLTFRHSRGQNIAETSPEPPDAKSLAQLSWQHMYLKAVALWHALSAAEKQDWESQARRRHMTGFAWFMSQALKPNPGLYLPLQGGTMAGDIDMDGHDIVGLPNVTKHIFLPALSGYPGTNTLVSGSYLHANIISRNALVSQFSFSFKVPDDFVSFVSFKLVWRAGAAVGDIYWQFTANYCAPGEHMATHSDAPVPGATTTAGASKLNVQEPANPLTLVALSLGDYIGIEMKRLGNHVDDTINQDTYNQGVLFTYVGKAF